MKSPSPLVTLESARHIFSAFLIPHEPLLTEDFVRALCKVGVTNRELLERVSTANDVAILTQLAVPEMHDIPRPMLVQYILEPQRYVDSLDTNIRSG